MTLPTPSALDRIAACPGSEALPHAKSSSAWGASGTAAHAFLARCQEHGRDAALEASRPEDRPWLSGFDVDRLPARHAGAYAAEVALAYSPVTSKARELGRGLAREQAHALAAPGEMVGIVDVLGLTADAVVVYDYKTGHGEVPPAERNWQLRTYALMAARAYGRDAAKGGIIRAREDGGVFYDPLEMDLFDLDAHETELLVLLQRRRRILSGEEKPPLHEGSHCAYCPAFHACPVKMTLVRSMVGEGDPLEGAMAALTVESAGRAWAKLKAAKALIERLETVLKDFARQQPVPLEDGKVLEELTEFDETLVAERARAPLIALWGESVGAAVYADSAKPVVKMTKAALDAALRKHALPTLPKAEAKIGRVVSKTLETMKTAGAVSVFGYQHVVEHRVKVEKKSRAAKALPAEAAPVAALPEGA